MKKAMWTVLLLLLFPIISRSEIIAVEPGRMPLTVALALCSDGDVIELHDGVYSEPEESFPLTISRTITVRAAADTHPIIEAPAFKAALRVEADGVKLQNLDIRFRRTGIYALGDSMTVESCDISLADEAWRTSSCGMWCGGIRGMVLRNCAFAGCGVCLAGPPLTESSKGLPVLTGLFEVGEDLAYFTSHVIENCTVNSKPLFYAVSQKSVKVPKGVGGIICCDCDEVMISDADVSGCSMGMVLTYNRQITLENCRADRCGIFGIYVAKCERGVLKGCSAEQSNHGLDIRASSRIMLIDCLAKDCDQGLFFSLMKDSSMIDCTVVNTGQGYFMGGGNGNSLIRCKALSCENGFNLQKEGRVLMAACVLEKCTVCGIRLDASPAALIRNILRDNWVGIMAYGGVSFEMIDNLLENNGICALYLREIGFSRFISNVIFGTENSSVQAIGTLGGSVWLNNTLDIPIDFSKAVDRFGLVN